MSIVVDSGTAAPLATVADDREHRRQEYRNAARHVAETLAERRHILAQRAGQAETTQDTGPSGQSAQVAAGGEECPARPTEIRSLHDALPMVSATNTMPSTGSEIRQDAVADAATADIAMTRSTLLGDPAPRTGSATTRARRPVLDHPHCQELGIPNSRVSRPSGLSRHEREVVGEELSGHSVHEAWKVPRLSCLGGEPLREFADGGFHGAPDPHQTGDGAGITAIRHVLAQRRLEVDLMGR